MVLVFEKALRVFFLTVLFVIAALAGLLCISAGVELYLTTF